MKYFTNCKTQEELKKEYRRLCKELHPDNGGNAADFQQMQSDFEEAGRTQAWRTFTNSKGETYTKEKTEETAADFMQIIRILTGLQGVNIELCGTWLWITGNTRSVKDELKAAGCRWSKSKTAWYWHKEPYRKRGRHEVSMERIRDMFGSEAVHAPSHHAEPQIDG